MSNLALYRPRPRPPRTPGSALGETMRSYWDTWQGPQGPESPALDDQGRPWAGSEASALSGQSSKTTGRPWAGSGLGVPPVDQTINGDDFASTSSSYSGLPSWAEDSARGLWGKMGPQGFAGYHRSIAGLNQVPSIVERMRQMQLQRFQRGIQDPTRGAVNSAIEQAAGRGTMGSTMYGDAMSRVADRLAAAGSQEHQNSNIWADNANLANISNKVQANAGFAALMADLLRSTSRSQSQSYNPSLMGLDFSPQ